MQFNVFPHDSKFDFMRLRWVSLFLAAAIMLVVGLTAGWVPLQRALVRRLAGLPGAA